MSVTQATLLGDAFGNEASGTIPVGGIIMWSGVYTPKGWVFCNGNNGEQINGLYIPDLRDRFIVGASNINFAAPATQGPIINPVGGGVSRNYEPGDTGGESAHSLTVDEMPSHNHTLTAGVSIWFMNPQYRPDVNYVSGIYEPGTTGNTGGGVNGTAYYHENRPPYYALAFIMRVS